MDHLKPPTEIELIGALEAAAAEILEATCRCRTRPHGSGMHSHEPNCKGVAGAQRYHDLANIARSHHAATAGRADQHAVQSPHCLHGNMKDTNAIDERVRKLALGKVWIVLRRWREGSEIRVTYSGAHLPAARNFERLQKAMQKGMVALVDARRRIVRYASNPRAD